MRRILWLVLLTGSLSVQGQAVNDYRSFQDGPWDDVNTWERFDGAVWVNPAPATPTSAVGATTILSGHTINVPAGFSVTIDQTTIQASATLLIDATASLTIANGAANDLTITSGSILDVAGTLTCNNAAVISGSTTSTTTFQSDAVYEHQYTTTEGSIPLANWDATPGAASTLRITGYTNWASDFATAGGNWSQSFGNVEWNCPNQAANFSLEGFLTTVNGSLTILATGAGPSTLRFTSTGTATINVGGDFNVSGNTEVGFCTSGSCTVNVGEVGVTIGNYTQNLSSGFVRFADGLNNGVGTINITGNFELQAGLLTELGGQDARGNINFVGDPGTIHTFTEAGTLSNSLSYTVADDNELIAVGESQMSGQNAGVGSFFTLGANAILRVESTDAAGAIQSGGGEGATEGNLQVTDANRVFNSGSQILYSGASPQFMGNGQPTVADITTILDNVSGVTQVAALTLNILGNVTLQTGDLTISNATLTIGGLTDLQSGNILFTSIGTARTLTLNDVNLDGDIVVTSGTANANLIFNGDVVGGSVVSFSGVNSNLILNGSGDIIFPLAGATSLETLTCSRAGEVTFNETLNVNTNAGASTFIISDGSVVVNGDINGRNITITNGSSLVVVGNTALTNIFTITNGTVETNGTLDITNDLTITSGSLDANGSVTLTDDLTLGPGAIFFFEDQTVTLNSQLINDVNNPGFFSSNENSTLNVLNTGSFTGDGTVNIMAFDAGGNTLGSFVLDRLTAGTLVALNSPLTVVNTYDLLDGDMLNISGLDFGDGAVATRNSAASLIAGSAIPTGGPYDLILEGASMTVGVLGQGALNDLTSNSTGTVTLGGAVNAVGNLIINSGVFTCGANNVSIAGYTHNGTTFNAPSTTLTITGDFDNNGTFNRNNGTVEFAGGSTFLGSVNPLFQNITLTGTLISPAILNLTGNFTNDGTFVPGSGTVVFTNTIDGTKTISGAEITTFNNLTIQNNTATPDVTMDGSVNLQGILTLNANAIVDADGAGTGVLTILSANDDTTVDGSIGILSGTSAITGDVTVQRYMSLEGPAAFNDRIYRYISSPVQNGLVADIQNEIPVTGTFTGSSSCTGCVSTSQSMFSYNESIITDTNGSGGNTFDDGYEDFPANANSEILVPGRGYAIFVRGNIDPVVSVGAALFDVRGPINSGTISLGNPGGLTFSSSGTAINDGWNLVGNPFPSTIDWNAATGWIRPAALDATIYIRDNGSDPQTYATWNGVTGTNGGSQFIAMGQGFWVKLNSTPTPATLSANENVKVAGTQTSFFRNGSPDDLIRITLKNGNKSDETVIHFREDATSAFDSHADAWKLANATINLSSFATVTEKLAINSLSPFDCTSEVKLDVSNVTPGNYTMEFTEFESFADEVTISLIDNFTSTITDVRASSAYNFQVTANANTYGSNRFKIQFSAPEIASDYLVSAETICEGVGGLLTIDNTQDGVSYVARSGGQAISNVGYGNGEAIDLTVNTQELAVGENPIVVEAFISGCKVEQPFIMQVASTDNLTNVIDGESCLSGTVLLKAEGAPASANYLWYESENAIETIGQGAEFTTPVLTQSKTYFVSVLNTGGCESIRTPVIATVHVYEPVEIYVEENSTLLSNYSEGNQWYRNGILIPGANGQELQVTQTGVYKVVVQIGPCETSAEIPMVITANEEASFGTQKFSAFPNPTHGLVTIYAKEAAVVTIIDSRGIGIGKVNLEPVDQGYSGSFDLSSFPSGLYIFKAVGADQNAIVKLYKN